MTSSEWKQVQITIRKKILNVDDSFVELTEEHCGGFLALINREGEILCEVSHLSEGLVDLSSTAETLCDKVVEQKLAMEEIKNSNVHLCVVRDAVYLKNPLEFDMSKDGVCFQWGDRYLAYYMPYEMARMNGDKVRTLDRLCCHKCEPAIISSAWRLPEGRVSRLLLDWHR